MTLANGLTVVMNEDRSVPNVAVELWVRAGSRFEDAGRWGQAHFFEHMFGATRVPSAPGRVLEGNAQTRRDFCRYYLLVDREAFEYALAVEADRLDYPLTAMTAARLNANRDIVINEYRGNQSRTFGFGSSTDVKLLVNGFGAQHPYGRPIQLNADVATLTDADMRQWMSTHYLPSESVLLIAGNFSVDRARPLIERYFGPIPAVKDGPKDPRARVVIEPIEPTPERRERMAVAEPAGRLLASWATPRYGTADADYLSLFAEILAAPEVGRLYRRLVSDKHLATMTAADAQIEELAGLIRATVILRPGVSTQQAESVFLQVIDELSQTGPSDAELQTAKARLASRVAHQWERLGFQGSRIDLLGEAALYLGDADAYRERLQRLSRATRDDVARAARMWVHGHGYILDAVPQTSAPATPSIDRSERVTLRPAPTPTFPPVDTKTLPGGMTVAIVERPQSGLVTVTIVMPAHAGSGSERTRGIMMRALSDRHPDNRSPRADAWRACVGAGGTINVSVDAAATVVTIETLADDAAIALKAMATLFTSLPPEASALTRAVADEEDRRSAQDPTSRVRAALANVVGGVEASNGQGNETMSAESIPPMMPTVGSTLLIVGGLQRSTIDATVNTLFADVRTHSALLGPAASAPARVAPAVYLMDVPGRTQTLIAAGHRLAPITGTTLIGARLAAAVAGARVNASLREQHHWAYGAQATLASAADGTPVLTITTEVQADRTADAIADIRRELGISVSAAETSRLPLYRRDLTQEILGADNSVTGVTAALTELARRGLPMTASQDLLRVAGTTDETAIVNSLRLVQPEALVFVLAGDVKLIGPQLEAVGIKAILLP